MVICCYPGVFSDLVIRQLNHSTGIKIAGFVYSQRIFSAKESWFGGALRMIGTSGLRYAILQFLQTDAYLLLRALCSRKPTVGVIPVLRTKDINSATGVQFLRSLSPDIIVLANFNQKVSEAVISTPAMACLNIHPSYLPHYKGVDPVFAALYDKASSLGVSVHSVDHDFDTGNILAQSQMTVQKGDSVFNCQAQLFGEGGKLAAQIIQQIACGKVGCHENSGGNYDSWPTKAKISAFTKNGGRLIRFADYLSVLKQLFFG